MGKEISAPLARTARLLDLVPFLTTHQGIALKDLARHFEVSTSQMSADLTTLWMCGLPGYTPLELMDLEFESGFVTIRNAETLSKPRSITFQEGVAMLLGLDLMVASLPEDRDDLKKIAISLRERIGDKLGVPVHVQATPAIATPVIAAVHQALAEGSGLQIEYHSLYKDTLTSRIILPNEKYELNGNQYLRAFCFTAEDFREFRIDRIKNAIKADVPQRLESNELDAEKIHYQITAKVLTRDIAERFALEQKAVDFSLTSYSEQWIERSVLASGEGVVLRAPEALRTQVLATAKAMLDRYEEA
jgi:proteasome accessory factor C